MLAQYYHILKDLIKFKSISTDVQYFPEMQWISQYLAKLLQEYGCQASVIPWYGNPIVVASYIHNPKLPTCLLYGHYDVQPADKKEGRKYDPFSLHLGKDKIYGRGVADNKWQFLIHVLTILSLIKHKNLAYNIKIILEWDEESGSRLFHRFLTDHKDMISADFCFISDSTLIGSVPCLDAGYRWGINLQLQIKTANTDLHSWLYGGVVPNAIQELTKIISQLYDMNHRITIPYFYYDVEEVEVDVMLKHRKMKFDYERFTQITGVQTMLKDKEFDLFTQIWLRPTIQVTGMYGWHLGEWYKNAIPNIATAQLNFRLVKHQSTQKVLSAFEQRLKNVIPPYATHSLLVGDAFEPVKINLNTPFVKKAERILQALYDQKVHYKYAGGGLPIVSLLHDELQLPFVLVPLVNEDANVHGVNENFDIALIEKWFEFSHAFFAAK